MSQKNVSTHWADIYAERIIREKGEKDRYVCASGITPSGTVHIGNFREIISVELVVRALRDRGKDVRFIYSWDDYDVFRKVPKNMPKPEVLAEYLRKPITLVPDTTGVAESYARAHEVEVEEILPIVGIEPEYLYQAELYRTNVYAEAMRLALEKRDEIRVILDEFRTEELEDDWWPISVFSSFTDKDTTTILGWDGEWAITYRDDETGDEETIDLRTTPYAKLPWRLDWPMRWAHEQVDFEPAGKDHHSEGGSFDTSRKMVQVFGAEAPVSFQYDFISIKGRGGKISSSSGEVISLRDVLEVYTPEVARYMFAGTRPNSEFAISFDLDVLKIYEDYDTCERIYFGLHEVNEKRTAREKRIYELSQVAAVPESESFQIPFRHLCNQLQIFSGDIEATLDSLGEMSESQRERLGSRARCAWNWITTYSPEEFRFQLADPSDPLIAVTEAQQAAIQALAKLVAKMDEISEEEYTTGLYDAAKDNDIAPRDFFSLIYQVLIGKERGPKLAPFIQTCGKDRVLSILGRY